MPRRTEVYRVGDFWLSKIPGSPYWYRTWFDKRTRQTRRESLRVEGLEDAKKALDDWYVEHIRPVDAKPEDVLLEPILTRYQEGRRETDQLAAGRLGYFFSGKCVGDLDQRRINGYIAFRKGHGVKLSTINRDLNTLRAALNDARKLGELQSIPHIPAVETAEDRRNAPPKGRPLSAKEMAALLDAAKAPHGVMLLMILCNTLCRPDAAYDLTPAQRDTEHGLLNLNPPGRKQTKKYRPIVPVTKTLKPWLDAAKSQRYYVQISKSGRKIESNAKRFVRETRKAAGLGPDVNLYSIRHTMARELRKRRVPAEQIELMLGHRRPDVTTQIYAPYEPDYCADAAAAIDAYFRELRKLLKRPLTPKIRLVRVSCVEEDGGR